MANFFTKQQIDDIRTALASDAKSDLELPETTWITGDDYVAVVQNGLNKKLNVNTFRNELQNGPQGESTYEIAVRHGYTGTEEESLRRQTTFLKPLPKSHTGRCLNLSAR